MSAGYSGTPLWKKLGVKEGSELVLLDAPAHIERDLGELPANANIRKALRKEQSLIVLFCKHRAALEKRVASVAKTLHRDGALWISWPKKSSALFIDLTEDGIRDVVLKMGLVDVKVCAVNDDWSGLKLMVRKELREGWNA